ncbi:MAG: arginyltransferase [Pseudomonadota bacterium]|nr:arginyltransferase [Pseudomonadota bacterium]
MNNIKMFHREDFFLSKPFQCAYKSHMHEKKIFSFIPNEDGEDLYNLLIQKGFRRSQNILYRQVCEKCSSCRSIRIIIDGFIPSKSQKRIRNKNKGLFNIKLIDYPSMEQFLLFKKYLSFKHPKSEMNEMLFEEYKNMIADSGIQSRIMEYRHKERLIACCISDFLKDSLSLVYSFYDPAYLKNSLGKYIILDHIQFAKSINKPYLYLGYWVEGCQEMEYKSNFKTSEILINNSWQKI